MSDGDPLSELERALDLFGDQSGIDIDAVPVDIIDDGDSFVVHADLPGFDSDDIDIKLVDQREVTISATHEETSEESDDQYLKRERRQQSTSRTVRLPEAVEEQETTAEYDDGVLTVTLPKATAGTDDGTDIPVN